VVVFSCRRRQITSRRLACGCRNGEGREEKRSQAVGCRPPWFHWLPFSSLRFGAWEWSSFLPACSAVHLPFLCRRAGLRKDNPAGSSHWRKQSSGSVLKPRPDERGFKTNRTGPMVRASDGSRTLQGQDLPRREADRPGP
jgi:hypothetical protein